MKRAKAIKALSRAIRLYRGMGQVFGLDAVIEQAEEALTELYMAGPIGLRRGPQLLTLTPPENPAHLNRAFRDCLVAQGHGMDAMPLIDALLFKLNHEQTECLEDL
jgi:hypothetical protein